MSGRNIQDIISSIKDVSMSKSALEILMNFERVLDDMGLYAFSNWKNGELVEGPISKKYRVTASFMWPLVKMPDPSGAARLLPYGIIVGYKKDWLVYPIEIHSPADYRPKLKKPKLSRTRVWVVTIDIPKHLITDVTKGSEEIMAHDVDLDDLDAAYEAGLDQDEATINQQDDTEANPTNPGANPMGDMNATF